MSGNYTINPFGNTGFTPYSSGLPSTSTQPAGTGATSYLSGNQGNDAFVGSANLFGSAASASPSPTSTLPTGSLGAQLLAQQSSGQEIQGEKYQALKDRRGAVSQIMDESYDTHKQFNDERAHQGAIGRFVEKCANGFNVKGSPKNVEKKLDEVDKDSREMMNDIGTMDAPGKNFNDNYKNMTGFDYDPDRPLVTDDDDRLKDGQFGGKLGEGQQALKDYESSQKKGMMAFSIVVGVLGGAACAPIGGVVGIAAGTAVGIATSVGTMAIEDNTRGDGTHDYNAGNYLSAAGTGALAGIGGGVGGALVGKGISTAASVGTRAFGESVGNGLSSTTAQTTGRMAGEVGGSVAGSSIPLPGA